jgi:hypothetical protein
MFNIRSLLQQFRQNLPDTSETARLIDIRAGLDDITETAEGEGLFSLIKLLTEAQQAA